MGPGIAAVVIEQFHRVDLAVVEIGAEVPGDLLPRGVRRARSSGGEDEIAGGGVAQGYAHQAVDGGVNTERNLGCFGGKGPEVPG